MPTHFLRSSTHLKFLPFQCLFFTFPMPTHFFRCSPFSISSSQISSQNSFFASFSVSLTETVMIIFLLVKKSWRALHHHHAVAAPFFLFFFFLSKKSHKRQKHSVQKSIFRLKLTGMFQNYVVLGWKKVKKWCSFKFSTQPVIIDLTTAVPGFPVEPAGFWIFPVF